MSDRDRGCDVGQTSARAMSQVLVALALCVITAVALGVLVVTHERGSDGTQGVQGLAWSKVAVLDAQWADSQWWTQGLDTLANGDLAISTGRDSSNSQSVSAVHRLPYGATMPIADDLTPHGQFGEGLAVMPHDVLWQLTWKSGVAHQRRGTDMRVIDTVPFDAEGWGVCYWRGNNSIVTSDGSQNLVVRDRTTLSRVRTVITPVTGLNELSCPADAKGDRVWANVYPSDLLVEISLITGEVTRQVDLRELAAPQRTQTKRHSDDSGAGAPNGITPVPGTSDEYYVTGKLWDAVYKVRIDEGEMR